MNSMVVSYILTCNTPAQLEAFLASAVAAQCGLERYPAIVVNQSSSSRCDDGYQQICEQYRVAHVRTSNAGASGGRAKCARHFQQSPASMMFYFEDDILFHPQRDPPGRCRFGFPNFVRDVLSHAVRIVVEEDLAYLKFNFHELWFDHSRNFTTQVPSFFEKLSVLGEAAYFVGDVYYSNWPMLITQAASQAIFSAGEVLMTEGTYMQRAQELRERGELRTGVLCAWPMGHDRRFDRGTKIDHVGVEEFAQHEWKWLSLGPFTEPIDGTVA